METIKVYLQSLAFMSCQLPLMGTSCKADRKVTALERKKKVLLLVPFRKRGELSGG